MVKFHNGIQNTTIITGKPLFLSFYLPVNNLKNQNKALHAS